MYILKINPKTLQNITLITDDTEKYGSKIYEINFNFQDEEKKILRYQLFTLSHCIWDEENKEFIKRETKNLNRYEQAKNRLIEIKAIEWVN